MTLFKRGSVWWAYFMMDGVRHQTSTGTTNRRTAECILRNLKGETNITWLRTRSSVAQISLGGPLFHNRLIVQAQSVLVRGGTGNLKQN